MIFYKEKLSVLSRHLVSLPAQSISLSHFLQKTEAQIRTSSNLWIWSWKTQSLQNYPTSIYQIR